MDIQQQEGKETEKAVGKCGGHSSCLTLYRKPLAVNVACLLFLFVYSIFGGFVFLHFEEPNWQMSKRAELAERIRCVEESLVEKRRNKREEEEGEMVVGQRRRLLAGQIVADCVLDQGRDERMEWNLKNAVLFGFGILTTLGYGKIEPQTTEGRLFTVLYGFVGVPFTVIIFTNFGRYLQKFERFVRIKIWQKWRQKWSAKCKKGRRKTSSSTLTRKRSCILPPITVELEDGFQMDDDELATIDGMEVAGEIGAKTEEEEEEAEQEQISPLTLICIVFLYLLLGAALIDWLDENVDFPNGIYFAFLCLTAIEYGKLIPTDALYLPLVIAYICFGLAISTIALDIGSTYVKKLYYLGQKIRNIASIKIWFGAKHLRVRELLAALGHNIGLEPTVLCDLDLEQLISNAIQVKEGRLHRVPQTHMIMDGIWPPELVPLFLKDGQFPDWVDAEERRKWSTASLLMNARKKSSFRGSGRSGILSIQKQKVSGGSVTSKRSATFLTLAANQPPERSPPLPPLLPEKLSVRFEEFVHSSNEFNKWPPLLEETSTSGVASDLSMFDQQLPASSRWSLFAPAPIDDTDENNDVSSSHYSNQMMMRRSETVPPIGHPESSLLHLCTFPSLEIHGPRAPLPPLTPLPDEDENEEEEEEKEEKEKEEEEEEDKEKEEKKEEDTDEAKKEEENVDK